MPEISVHIVTYNSAKTLPMCLAALRSQTGCDFQVSVFDNGSVDETCAIVREAQIPLIESRDNRGYADAHNVLVAQTQSTYILTLNPDVRLLPGFLSAMKRALDADARIGSAAGLLLRVDQIGDQPTMIDSAGLGMRRNRHQRLLGERTPIDKYPSVSRPIFGPDGAAAFYRRAMLEDIAVMGEVFDADFFLHKEDIDVCWRAQLRGWSSLYVPEAIAHHVRSFRPGQREQVSADLRCYAVRNRYLLMLKNEIGSHFLRDFPLIAAYDAALLAYLLLRERESLAALRSAWQLRKRMIEKRRIIQSRRSVGWREIAQWFKL